MLVLPARAAHVPPPVLDRLTSAHGHSAAGAGTPRGGASSGGGGTGGSGSKVCYAAGRLAIVTDVESQTQRAYEGHTAMVTCLAVDPNGTRIASAQQGNATQGTVAYASIWDVATLRELTRVGWSLAALGGPGVGGRMSPCFERSICALAFSDGALLLCVGTSSGEQHTLCAFDVVSGRLSRGASP